MTGASRARPTSAMQTCVKSDIGVIPGFHSNSDGDTMSSTIHGGAGMGPALLPLRSNGHRIDLTRMDLTIVVVTSPTRANPALGPLPQAIESFQRISGVDTCAGGVIIVADGYVVSSNTQTKRGRVSPRTAANYDLYCSALCRAYTPPRFRVIRCPEHVGFAHAVKAGLHQVTTTYALVAQHDRVFIDSFDRLPAVLDTIERHEWVRYVGFPSVMNRQHANLLHCKYGLKELADPASRIPVAAGGTHDATARDREASGSSTVQKVDAAGAENGANTTLMPLIFWYDSQHVCHVERYLRIFDAPTDVPAHLKDILGPELLSSMRLRRGDFIEDRFGQAQKKMMTTAGIRQDPLRVQELFRYFGSYLLWEPQAYANELVGGRARTFVGHLRGRQQSLSRLSHDGDGGDAVSLSENGGDWHHVHGSEECDPSERRQACTDVGGHDLADLPGDRKGAWVGLGEEDESDVDVKEREWLASIATFVRAQSLGAPLRLTQIASQACVPRPEGVKEKLVKLVRRRGHAFGLFVAGKGCDVAVGVTSGGGGGGEGAQEEPPHVQVMNAQ